MCLLGRFFCLHRLMTRFGSRSTCRTPADSCLCRAVREANFEHISWRNLFRVQSWRPAGVQIIINWPSHKILISLILRWKFFLPAEGSAPKHSRYGERSLWTSDTVPGASSSFHRAHHLETRHKLSSLETEHSCSILREKKNSISSIYLLYL